MNVTHDSRRHVSRFRRDPEKPKRTIFLVPTVPLVDQQSDFFARNTGFKCGSFCGSDNVDDWDRSKWQEVMAEHEILVMVHQVFLDALNRAYIHFDFVNLLIIDEIHHCRKNHPYNQIFRKYREHEANPDSSVPHVLGLTASIVTEKCDERKFLTLIKELEDNTSCKIITTVNLASLLK